MIGFSVSGKTGREGSRDKKPSALQGHASKAQGIALGLIGISYFSLAL